MAAIFDPRRFSLIEASTKSGKTHGCLCWLIEQALLGGGIDDKGVQKNYSWIAPVSQQSEMAFTRMVAYLPQGTFMAVRSSPKRIILLNGAVIWFKSGDKPNSLYGDDIYAAVIDEASRFKEEAWQAIRSTLTYTKGPCRIIGNVKGRRNWFYALARRAESGNEIDLGYHRMTAYDAVTAGVLTDEEIAGAKRHMPEAAFRELYLAEPSDDGGNPFGLNNIAQCVGAMSTERPIVWGWDLGKSVNYTVGIGLDDMGIVSRFVRIPLQQPWWIIKRTIMRETDGVDAFVDSTGVGDPIVDELQHEAGSWFQGYKFTPHSKQQLMEGLQMAIQERAITIPDRDEGMPVDHPGHIRHELETFEYQYAPGGRVTYSAPEGYYDDCVCSLALAVACKTTNRSLSVWDRL